MKILHLDDELNVKLQSALQDFEAEFTYPLGENKKFRISHGEKYTAFYQSMGETICLVAIEDNKVFGTFSCALRHYITSKTNEKKRIAYLGDLKVTQQKTNTSTYQLIAHQMIEEVQTYTTEAICVVMKGNTKTPKDYTGRLSIPKFNPLYDITILRIDTRISNHPKLTQKPCPHIDSNEFLRFYGLFCQHDYFLPEAFDKRSKMTPQYFTTADHKACGILEDTQKAKILYDEQGKEIRSAHLSYFEYENPISAANLLQSAVNISYHNNYPALFVCLPMGKSREITSLLKSLDYEQYGATVYGNDAASKIQLNINTSEI